MRGGALLILLASIAQAAPPLAVTYKAAIIGFVDGDTLDVEAKLWPGVKTDDARVRLRGIDTPELERRRTPRRQWQTSTSPIGGLVDVIA